MLSSAHRSPLFFTLLALLADTIASPDRKPGRIDDGTGCGISQMGFGGAMGGIVFGEVAGYLLDRGFDYSLVFRIAGTFHIAAFLIILVALPTIEPLSREGKWSYGEAQ